MEQVYNFKNVLRLRALRGENTVVTFVDFRKAYDSIDRQSMFKTLKDFGVDNKTKKLIEQTLTNTVSKVKFKGEISDPSKIGTGLRHGDRLSPMLFNLILEKIIREWRLKKEENGIRGNNWETVKIK